MGFEHIVHESGVILQRNMVVICTRERRYAPHCLTGAKADDRDCVKKSREFVRKDNDLKKFF